MPKYKNKHVGQFKSKLENNAYKLLTDAGLNFEYEP